MATIKFALDVFNASQIWVTVISLDQCIYVLFTPKWTRRPRTLNVVWVKQFVNCLPNNPTLPSYNVLKI